MAGPDRDRATAALGDGRGLVVGKVESHLGNMVSLGRMISEPDIWRAANLLIRQHGDDAKLEAARLQDLMLDRGDDEGRLVCARIRRAIELL